MTNQKNTKKIAKNTIFLYIRMLLIMAVQFFTIRITLQALGVEDYGIYNVVGGVTNVFTFLTHTMITASQRFFSYDLGKNDIVGLRKSFDSILMMFFVLGLAIVILLQIFGSWFIESKLSISAARMDAALVVFLITNIMLFVNIMSLPFNSLIIAHEDMNVFAYISIVDAVLKLVIVYILVSVSYDKLILYSLLMLAASAVGPILYLWYCQKNYEECDRHLQLDKNIVKRVVPFMSWNLLGGVSWMLCTQGMSILVNIFFGPVINAAKAISDKINSSVTSFSNNFTMATQPQIIKTYANGQMNEMHQLIFFSSNISLFLMYVLAIPIIFNTKALLNLWLIDVPTSTIEMTQLVLIFAHIGALENPINQAIRATGNIKAYQWKLSIVTLCVIPVAYVFFKLGADAYYSYIALILVYSAALLYRLVFLKKQIGIAYQQYFKNVIARQLKCLPVILIVCYAFSLLSTDTLINTLLMLAVEAILSATTIFLLGLSKEEKGKVFAFIKSKRR